MDNFIKNKDIEIIEDLQYKNYRIIQRKDGFKFGIDAVLAVYFSERFIKPEHRVLDLGTGTGIIAILTAARTEAREITGIDIQEDLIDMARRSVKLNNLDSRVYMVLDDISASFYVKSNYYDHVITNPPYKKSGTGILNPSDSKAISRHEILCNLEDVISLSSKCLTPRGYLTMVNRPERLCDILELMRKYKIEPKSMRFVHSSLNKLSNLILIRGIKGGMSFLKVEPPLYIFDENGNYTKEINNIYNRS